MKKLEGNGLWESSRMMLFEHKDTLLDRKKAKKKKTRPVLDEQHRDAIGEKVGSAFAAGRPVTVRVYGDWEDATFTGVVSKVDTQRRRIQIDEAWIALADVLEIAENEEPQKGADF